MLNKSFPLTTTQVDVILRVWSSNMPLIEVTEQDAELLNQLAPTYLRGRKQTTRQVAWSIQRLSELLADVSQQIVDPDPATPAQP
jgi:hypothetical protein